MNYIEIKKCRRSVKSPFSVSLRTFFLFFPIFHVFSEMMSRLLKLIVLVGDDCIGHYIGYRTCRMKCVKSPLSGVFAGSGMLKPRQVLLVGSPVLRLTHVRLLTISSFVICVCQLINEN